MSDAIPTTILAAPAGRAASPEKALRRLFFTLFLRGRTSRGLQRQTVPRSIGRKLVFTLVFYLLFGCLALNFLKQNVFVLAVYLHAMTFIFLGLFISSSAGEILFNKDEADILLHRPINPKTLLWAKVRVLVEISLWLAGAFNLVGFVVGVLVPDGGWRFPLVHAASTTMEALFCTACVIMVYQLCIRWFGRERLEGMLTTAQVLVSISAVLAGQVLPQIAMRFGTLAVGVRQTWWTALLPPAWFACLDDAVAGSGGMLSIALGGLAVAATAVVLWLAFGKLAVDYQAGLQRLNENVSPTGDRRTRRWIASLVNAPPLSWWLRNPVTRASFLLTTAYLLRDREVKLRIYPSIAPMLVMPFIFMLRREEGSGTGFGVAFAGAYVGVVPLLALGILQFSQQWQASDIFRAAPLAGPAAICHGARRAVLCFIALPVVLAFGVIIYLLGRNASDLLLLLPGLVVVPVYAVIPGVLGKGVPFTVASQEGKSAGRGVTMIVAMLVSMALAGLATLAHRFGLLAWMLLAEAVMVAGVYAILRLVLAGRRWPAME